MTTCQKLFGGRQRHFSPMVNTTLVNTRKQINLTGFVHLNQADNARYKETENAHLLADISLQSQNVLSTICSSCVNLQLCWSPDLVCGSYPPIVYI